MAGPTKKRGDLSIDFTGVESGGRSIPDDDYLMQVLSIEEKESQEGNAYLAWKWMVAEGPFKGATVYDNTSLKPTALWRLKQLLECLGIDVSGGKMSLSFKEYIGKTCLVKIANETYQGKEKPRIADFLRGSTLATESSSKLKNGMKVTFPYEDAVMDGVVTSVEGDKVIVMVTVDDGKEEWELTEEELTVV